jgi:transposase
MKFTDFIGDLLVINREFEVVKIEKDESIKAIFIYVKYLPKRYRKDAESYCFYDSSPERTWQHLSWFEYKCFIKCSLPRYVNSEGKVATIDVSFAPKSRSYTLKFSDSVIFHLQTIRVQNTVAKLLQTTAYKVRSIMEDAVNRALETRGFVSDFKHVSLDEKAYKDGHKYASILINSDKECVLNLVEGRKEKSVKALFFELNEQEFQPQIEVVNIDMWKPYMNVMQELSPYALQVHDKFHLVKKLSEAIDKTRRSELKDNPILVKQKYTVLKNKENRTEQQQRSFETIAKANLETSKAWVIRENFKSVFKLNHWLDKLSLYKNWLEDASNKNLKYVNRVLETFKRHHQGIVNAIVTGTTSGKHENLNGRIQAVLAKARGFLNFDRFKINVMFYFGKLEFTH